MRFSCVHKNVLTSDLVTLGISEKLFAEKKKFYQFVH